VGAHSLEWEEVVDNLSAKLGVALSLLLTLSNCGGAGEPTVTQPPLIDLTDRIDGLNAMSDRIIANGISFDQFSPGVTVTNSGRATYAGYAIIVVTEPGAVAEDDKIIALYGDTDITVTFHSDDFTGQLSNFAGGEYTGDLSDNATGVNPAEFVNVAHYDGVILLSGGDIKVLTNNDFNADISGTLTGNGDSIVLNGVLIGAFGTNGPDGKPQAIISDLGQSILNVTYNGTVLTTDNFLGIIAEKI
jgi:hypothetical protein